jgi:REP element-mobilizing transposase RayT
VDVNILGHIFENSLSEIEEVAAQIEGTQVDLKKSKRKKDGVFYTPKYITKYIVENTVGTLCSEKKATLEIDESEYLKSRKGRTTKKLKELDDKLTSYRNWLLTLTICDPACGSGAFLNQALDFLIREHRYIDELRAKLLEVPMVFTEVENSILENNIYGVDINDESVEIARLSLWLRTAKKGRKLTTLSNNIKCGNSLIDDPAVAGEKAFHWPAEFPEVFRKKEKKAWHITTATHNSRYSQRMFDNYVKRGEPVWLGEKEELIVTETIANIAINDQLNIAAYNVCGDHVHMILVCEDTEVPKIVGKIKSMSARACNIAMGRTVPKTEPDPDTDTGTRGHAPLSDTPVPDTLPSAPSVSATLPSATSVSATLSSSISVSEFPVSATSSSETSVSDTRTSGVSPETASERGETQAQLWTQKFGCKEITSEEQLQNTVAYINNNRIKHELPHNKDLQPLVQRMVCSLEHAFRTEYTGGFDVVIGNPPYVQLQSMGEMSNKLKNCGYETFDKGADLYCIFTERGFKLLKPGGLQSFIMPNKWMLVAYGKPLRKFLSKTGLRQILNFGDVQFFQEATTYVCIFVTEKSGPKEKVKVLSFNRKTYHGDFLTEVKNNIYAMPVAERDP